MGRRLLLITCLVLPPFGSAADTVPAWLDGYRAPAARLIEEATRDTFAWDRLAVLTDTIGARYSSIQPGGPSAAIAAGRARTANPAINPAILQSCRPAII